MEQRLPRVLTVTAMCACAGLLAVAACTHTTDRVLEPVGGGDASTTAPELGDASLAPIGPVARPPVQQKEDPSEDFRLARSPELGLGFRAGTDVDFATTLAIKTDNGLPGGGAGGASGNGGGGGGNRGTPVAAGGFKYF